MDHNLDALLNRHFGFHIDFGLRRTLETGLALNHGRVHGATGRLQANHNLLEHAHGCVRLDASPEHGVRLHWRQMARKQKHAHYGQLSIGPQSLGPLHD